VVVSVLVTVAVSGRMRQYPAVNRLPDVAGCRPANSHVQRFHFFIQAFIIYTV